MKALKEKRISLRSLWRRGLVILSLFALVFASCSESGAGLDGKTVKTISVITAPAVTQYLGAPVNIDALEIEVEYWDGTKERLKGKENATYFSVTPRAATGVYNRATYAFTGMPSFLVNVMGVGIRFPASVVDIVRARGDSVWFPDEFLTGDPADPGDIPDDGVFSTGVDVTGILKNEKMRNIYADFEGKFDFEGFTVQATYINGQSRYINLEDIKWAVFPDYGGDLHPNKTADGQGYYYPGWVYMMVGADNENVMNFAPYNNVAMYYRYGVTDRKPLDKVFTVESFTIDQGAKLDDFFFWSPNTPATWAAQLGAKDWGISVKYSNGTVTPKKISDLIAPERIWWDFNPARENKDFYVRPLSYPFNLKTNYDPYQGNLILYYRGIWGEGVWGSKTKAPALIPIPVYTKFISFEIDYVGGNDKFTLVDAAPALFNNDGYEGSIRVRTEQELAAQLLVQATYEAYNFPGQMNDPKLTLTLAPRGDLTWAGAIANMRDGTHYITDFNTLTAKIIGAKTVEDVPKSIKINYTVDDGDVTANLLAAPVNQMLSYVRPGAARVGSALDIQSPPAKNAWNASTNFGFPLTGVATDMEVTKFASKTNSKSILWTYRRQ